MQNPSKKKLCPKFGLFFGEKEKERKQNRGPCFVFQRNLSFSQPPTDGKLFATLRPGRCNLFHQRIETGLDEKSKCHEKIDIFFVHPYITYINLKKLNFPINNVESTKTKNM